MGKFNSSTTRVAPVFDRLYAADATGASWLPTLLDIGRHDVVATRRGQPPQLVANHGARWGRLELSLPAPLGLLEHLVHTISKVVISYAPNHDIRVSVRRQATAIRIAEGEPG